MQNVPKVTILLTIVQTTLNVRTVKVIMLLTLAHVHSGNKNEKEIIKLKVTENISFPEARKRLSFLQKGTFSQVVRRGRAPSSVSTGPLVCKKCRGSLPEAPSRFNVSYAPSQPVAVVPVPPAARATRPGPKVLHSKRALLPISNRERGWT